MARCKVCKQPKPDPLRPTCFNFDCQVNYATKHAKKQRTQKEKKERAKIKTLKATLKTKAKWFKEAQVEFNSFIRVRDRGEECISCQRPHAGQYHAGHYRSVGAHPELRFNEDNCHKQCSACNNHLSGNIVDYRINLVKKIGQDRVDIIEGPHEAKKYTIDDIREIKALYKRKLKKLKG